LKSLRRQGRRASVIVRKEMLRDIAILTGGQVISEESV